MKGGYGASVGHIAGFPGWAWNEVRRIVSQLPNPMTFTLSLLALVFIFSFGLLLLNILSAPEGYEDETGFHATNVAGAKVVAVNQSQVFPAYAKSVTHHGLI